MRIRPSRLAGFAAPLVYAVAVVLGGALSPGYRHVAQPISDLVATGAPAKALLDPLFAAYGVLTLVFAAGQLRDAVRDHGPRAGWGRAGAAALLLEAVAGLATLGFPEGAGGAGGSLGAGAAAHIGLAALSSITSVAAVALLGAWFAASGRGAWLRPMSLATAGAIVVSGAVAAALVAGTSRWAGLAERVTIGLFLAWLALAAVVRDR